MAFVPAAKLLDAARPLSDDQRNRLASMSDCEKQMHGFLLTTVNIIYRMPDARSVLNTFVFQAYDMAPDFPVLFDFIAFWDRSIEAPLHGVVFAGRSRDVMPSDWRNGRGVWKVGGVAGTSF